MPRRALSLLLSLAALGSLGACASDELSEISNARQERYFARSMSAESRVRNLVRRFHDAEEKIAEYDEVVAASETDLAAARAAAADLREANARKAREAQALRDEATQLEADLAASRQAVAEAQAAIKASQAEMETLSKSRAELQARQAALRTEVEALEAAHPEARGQLLRVKRLLGMR